MEIYKNMDKDSKFLTYQHNRDSILLVLNFKHQDQEKQEDSDVFILVYFSINLITYDEYKLRVHN